ncbi:MAG: hypothetical protein H8E51_08660 [Bacteroidetes bacterium]|nr:hypothetical protein [Bacteroidota bacterium]
MPYVIEFINNVEVEGQWFLQGWQFEFTGPERTKKSCTDCNATIDRYIDYYTITYDGVEYTEVPADCVSKRFVREIETDMRTSQEKYIDEVTTDKSVRADGTTDYVQAAKDYLDIDIAAKNNVNQADLAMQDDLRQMIENHQQRVADSGKEKNKIGVNQPEDAETSS